MSSLEFSEWVAFYGLEPFGRDADFMGHAQTALTVYSVHRSDKDPELSLEDFMPQDRKPPQTADQMKQFATAITIALGGTVKEK